MTPLALGVLLIVLGFLAILTGLAWVAVPLWILGIAALIWGAVVFVRGGRSTPVTHRTRKAELLGPGGPDDPER